MAKINCCGDCTMCEHLRNGETNPAECASIWGFMGVQKMHANMVAMHTEIMGAVAQIQTALGGSTAKPIPGIEYEPNEPTEAVEETETKPGEETPVTTQ